MTNLKIRKSFAVATIFVFILTALPLLARAKDSYESLASQNQDLKNQAESLIKEQEQLRDIYRVLLEKVKVLQRDNEILTQGKAPGAAAEEESRRAAGELKKELADARSKIADMEKSMPTGRSDAEAKAIEDKNRLKKEFENMRLSLEKQAAESKKFKNELREQYTRAEDQGKKAAELSVKLQAALDGQEALLKESLASRKAPPPVNDKKMKKFEADVNNLSSVIKNSGERIKSLEGSLAANRDMIAGQAKKLKAQEERTGILERDLARANNSLKEADEIIKTKDRDTKKLEKVFDKSGLKKAYPEIFDRNNPVKFYKASPEVKRVERQIHRLDLERKDKWAQAALAAGVLKDQLARKEKLRAQIASGRAAAKQAKESLDEVSAEIKLTGREAAADDENIKTLREAMASASAEQKSAEDKLRGTERNIGEIEAEMKKLAAQAAENGRIEPGSRKQTTSMNLVQKKSSPKAAAPAPAPAIDTTALKAFQANLDKANEEKNVLKIKASEADEKVRKLELAITEEQDKAKAAAAAEAKLRKEKLRQLQKNIAGFDAKETALKSALQHLAKKIKIAKAKDALLKNEIKAYDTEIRGLKQIIEKEVHQIEASMAEAAGPKRGLADEARAALARVRDEVDSLRAKNAELEKKVKDALQEARDADRKAELDRRLPEELERDMKKEKLNMHYNLGVLYEEAGRYKDAEREYLKCLKINPEDAGVHYNLGILYDDDLNDNRKALYYYRQYLKYRPMGENTMLVRGWITDIELENRLGREVR